MSGASFAQGGVLMPPSVLTLLERLWTSALKLSPRLPPKKMSGAKKQVASKSVMRRAAKLVRPFSLVSSHVKAGQVERHKMQASNIAGIKGFKTMMQPIKINPTAIMTGSWRRRGVLSEERSFMG